MNDHYRAKNIPPVDPMNVYLSIIIEICTSKVGIKS